MNKLMIKIILLIVDQIFIVDFYWVCFDFL